MGARLRVRSTGCRCGCGWKVQLFRCSAVGRGLHLMRSQQQCHVVREEVKGALHRSVAVSLPETEFLRKNEVAGQIFPHCPSISVPFTVMTWAEGPSIQAQYNAANHALGDSLAHPQISCCCLLWCCPAACTLPPGSMGTPAAAAAAVASAAIPHTLATPGATPPATPAAAALVVVRSSKQQ